MLQNGMETDDVRNLRPTLLRVCVPYGLDREIYVVLIPQRERVVRIVRPPAFDVGLLLRRQGAANPNVMDMFRNHELTRSTLRDRNLNHLTICVNSNFYDNGFVLRIGQLRLSRRLQHFVR